MRQTAFLSVSVILFPLFFQISNLEKHEMSYFLFECMLKSEPITMSDTAEWSALLVIFSTDHLQNVIGRTYQYRTSAVLLSPSMFFSQPNDFIV